MTKAKNPMAALDHIEVAITSAAQKLFPDDSPLKVVRAIACGFVMIALSGSESIFTIDALSFTGGIFFLCVAN